MLSSSSYEDVGILQDSFNAIFELAEGDHAILVEIEHVHPEVDVLLRRLMVGVDAFVGFFDHVWHLGECVLAK